MKNINLFERAKHFDYKTKYLISYLAFTSSASWLSFWLTIILALIFFFFPNKTVFSFKTTDWVFENWNTDYSNIDEMIEKNWWLWFHQSLAWFWLSFLMFAILMQTFTIANYLKLQKNNRAIFEKDFVSLLEISLNFWQWIKLSKLNEKKFLQKRIFENCDFESINHLNFWRVFVSKAKFNFQWLVTLTFYVLLLSCWFVFVTTWLTHALSYTNILPIYGQSSLEVRVQIDEFIKIRPFTGVMSFFTINTNFLVLFYLLVMLYKPKARIYSNNTFSILIGTYIIIVGLVYWLFLFNDQTFLYRSFLEFMSSIFSHGVVPVLSIIFIMFIIVLNKQKPISFKKTSTYLLAYPLTYGAVIYLLPLFSSISVYSFLTNINPYHVIYTPKIEQGIIVDAEQTPGNALFIIGIFVFALAFIFFCFIFWIYTVWATDYKIFKKKK